MKRLLYILIAALLLLCGCSNKASDMEYTNIALNYGSFQVGDIIYSLTPSGITRYHANWENCMSYFCTDPLCDHSGTDGVCPDCYELSGKSYVTDGERIYMNARSYLPDLTGNIKRDYYQIYSFLPDGSDMKLLTSFDGSSGTQLVFADGAFWYSPADVVYHGTKDMPTGNVKETAPVDFISYTDGSLVRYDLKTAESQTWRDEDTESEITFLGISEDAAIIEIGNTAKEFRDGNSGKEIFKATLNNNGTLTISGKIEAVQ